jgi:hypothetical protein
LDIDIGAGIQQISPHKWTSLNTTTCVVLTSTGEYVADNDTTWQPNGRHMLVAGLAPTIQILINIDLGCELKHDDVCIALHVKAKKENGRETAHFAACHH